MGGDTFTCRTSVTGGEHDGTSGQSPSAGALGSASDKEIGVPPIGNGDVYNDGEI